MSTERELLEKAFFAKFPAFNGDLMSGDTAIKRSWLEIFEAGWAAAKSSTITEVVLPELPEGEDMAFDRKSGKVLKRYTRAHMDAYARSAIALNRCEDAQDLLALRRVAAGHDADREPGDDVAWCEARAAQALPAVRAALNRLAAAPSPAPAPEPATSDKWEGAEEWMSLAWQLCANECGEESCAKLVWEGGPIPEPWGDRWLKYEDQAKEMIAMARKHVPSIAGLPTDNQRTNHMSTNDARDAARYRWLRDPANVYSPQWDAIIDAGCVADALDALVDDGIAASLGGGLKGE